MTHTSIIAYLIKIAKHKIAIPRSRFAIALPNTTQKAIALGQSNLQAIPAERFAIALYQSNLQAIPRSRFAIALAQSNLRAIPAERFDIMAKLSGG
ncbi:hypothetical protein [Anabaena sp. AL09]|jgi:hypothetical protein|uniref:hypothetical protein n=1 Tax=Anabaena sp. AL09 TaxID=1710891 RepID=UPI0007FEA43C|nr:hypothetical protein [Anabaena sp. AL09]OBQ13334.1 MAG: hypothetical protein AN490_02920 [Anabaena sp. AL09]